MDHFSAHHNSTERYRAILAFNETLWEAAVLLWGHPVMEVADYETTGAKSGSTDSVPCADNGAKANGESGEKPGDVTDVQNELKRTR